MKLALLFLLAACVAPTAEAHAVRCECDCRLWLCFAAVPLVARCVTATPPHAYEGRLDFKDASEAADAWMCARHDGKVECIDLARYQRGACPATSFEKGPKPLEL